jgi:hypothetical protein
VVTYKGVAIGSSYGTTTPFKVVSQVLYIYTTNALLAGIYALVATVTINNGVVKTISF